jgi:hypothetical protein
MKYIITKKQYGLLVEQSVIGLGPGLAYVDPKWTHETAILLSIATAFIPVVGPYMSAGIQLLDAAKYLQEGDKKMAGLMAMFAILPGVVSIVGKIPGIKQLGTNGMKLLAQKLSSGNLKNLSKIEQSVVEGISKNGEFVSNELSNSVKSTASKASVNVTNTTVKEQLKNLAKTGLKFSGNLALNIGGYAAAGQVYSSVFDAVQKREEQQNINDLETKLKSLGY